MFKIITTIGKYAVQFFTSIGIYELYEDSIHDHDADANNPTIISSADYQNSLMIGFKKYVIGIMGLILIILLLPKKLKMRIKKLWK